jgi:hypothetical protein
MFTCDMAESQQPSIPLNGIEPTIAEKLIEFAYTSELAITQVRRQFQSEEELTSGFIKL